MMKDESIRNISNVKVSKECFKRLRIMSIEQDTTVQEIVANLLEKLMSKKHKDNTSINIMNALNTTE